MLGRAKVLGTLLMVLTVAGCGDMWGDLWGSKRSAEGTGDGGVCTAGTKDNALLTQIILTPPACDANRPCPCGSYCSSTITGVCVVDCRDNTECATGKTCSVWGQCLGSGSGDGGVPANPSCPRDPGVLASLATTPRLCDFDDICPYGSYCNPASGHCEVDCASDAECPSDAGQMACNCLGKCVPVSGATPAPKSHLPSLSISPTNILLPKPTSGPPPGTGLLGTYFDQANLSGNSFTRVDSSIDFNWGEGSPDPRLPDDGYSARWTGQVLATTTETYTFSARADDGVRVYVSGQLIINGWQVEAPTTYTGTVALVAGHRYDIVVEYFDMWGGAEVSLSWSTPSISNQLIPTSQLYPGAAGASTTLDWDVRSVDVSLVTDYLTDGQTPPPVTVVPGPNVQIGCPGMAMAAEPCTFVPGAFSQQNGDSYRATASILVGPLPTAAGDPAATGWSVRFGSTEATSSPQTLTVSYSTRGDVPAVGDTWVDIGSLPSTYSGVGIVDLIAPTGGELRIPVSARGDNNLHLVLNDETKTLSPSGKLALNPRGSEPTADNIEDWIAMTATPQIDRATGVSTVEVIPHWMQQNTTTGDVVAWAELRFRKSPLWMQSAPDYSSVIGAKIRLSPDPSRANLCSPGQNCGAGKYCDLGFCSSGRATGVNAAGGLTSWGYDLTSNFWMPVHPDSPTTTGAILCPVVEDNSDDLQGRIASASGDLLCGYWSGGAGGAAITNLGPPLAIPLLAHRDFEELGLRKSLSATELLSACLSELNRPSPVAANAQGYIQDFVSGYREFSADCINVGLFISALESAQSHYQSSHQPQDFHVDSGPALFLHLLQQWVELHGFIARESLEEKHMNDALADAAIGDSLMSSANPTTSNVLDEMESGWALLFKYLVLSPDTYSTPPDYRRAMTHDACQSDADCKDPLQVCNSSTSECEPKGLKDAPQHEQPAGLAPALLEASTGHIMLVEELLGEAAVSAYGNVQATDLFTKVMDRYGIAMRFSLQAEAYAATIHDAYSQCTSCTQPGWEERWKAAKQELDNARERANRKMASIQQGLNPLGIPEDDVPLFFGDVAGTNSRYFAASDYLINGWANPSVQTAQASLEAARSAWIAAANSRVQDELLKAEQETRIEQLKAKYGQVIIDNCGQVKGPDGSVLEASQVLDVFASNPSALDACFIKPECAPRDPENPNATASLIDAVINNSFQESRSDPRTTDSVQASDRFQFAPHNPTQPIIWSEMCKMKKELSHLGKEDNQKLQDFLQDNPCHLLGSPWGFPTPHPNTETEIYCEIRKMDDGMYIGYNCPRDDHGLCGPTAPNDKLHDNPPGWLMPIAALYRPVRSDEFAHDKASPVPTNDQYHFFDIRSDVVAYEEATEDCVTAGSKNDNIQDVPLPRPAELPAECYLGRMGAYYNEVKNAVLGVKAANQALASRHADLSEKYKTCADLQHLVDEADRLKHDLETMQSSYENVSRIWGGISAIGNAYAGNYLGALSSVGGIAKSIIGDHAKAEQQAYQDLQAKFSFDATVRQCWDSFNTMRRELADHMTSIQLAEGTLRVQKINMQNAYAANQQALTEGAAVVARESGRPFQGYSHHYWVDEKVERYKREFEWARRLTFLAMRAVEYEFQQSLSLRSQIVGATNPNQLEDVIRVLQQQQASRTINRRRPEQSGIVLSLRDDLLHIEDRSDAGPGERAWTPADRLKGRLSTDRYAYHDKKGNWLGQGVPFFVASEGILDTRCGERMWRVTATVQGDGLSPDEPGVPLLLLKRNTFYSKWCAGKSSDGYQMGVVHPSAQLFSPGDNVDLSDGDDFTAAMIYPWFNVRRTDFYKTSYQDGSSEELAGRGLYGEYVLLFPKELLEKGFPIDKVEDVLLRIDYLSVDNLAQ